MKAVSFYSCDGSVVGCVPDKSCVIFWPSEPVIQPQQCNYKRVKAFALLFSVVSDHCCRHPQMDQCLNSHKYYKDYLVESIQEAKRSYWDFETKNTLMQKITVEFDNLAILFRNYSCRQKV